MRRDRVSTFVQHRKPQDPFCVLGGLDLADLLGIFEQQAGRLLRERRVLMFLGVWFIANFIFGAGSQFLGLSDGPVAWLAHVGGFVFGFVAFPLFDRRRRGT